MASKTILCFLEACTLFVYSFSSNGLSCDIDASPLVVWGTYLDGFNFWSLTVTDIGSCARSCIRMTVCLSFNFNIRDRTCDLNSDLLENQPGAEIKKPNSAYSRIKDWPREVSYLFV